MLKPYVEGYGCIRKVDTTPVFTELIILRMLAVEWPHSTTHYRIIQLQFELELVKLSNMFSITNLFLKHVLCHSIKTIKYKLY